MRYHHIGIPTDTKHAGKIYLSDYRLYCTDHERNPFGIQWMRYERDCPLPELVKTQPHVAFEVNDLEEAIKGHEILIPPNRPSERVVVAFVVSDGAPVEFLHWMSRIGHEVDAAYQLGAGADASLRLRGSRQGR